MLMDDLMSRNRQLIVVVAFTLFGHVSVRAQSISNARVAVVNRAQHDRRTAPDSVFTAVADSSRSSCGTTCTVLIGAGVGGVTGAAIAANQSYHPDDDIGLNRGLAIGISAAIGVAVGAIAGAIIAAVR
jgi:hypothetical protein